VPTSVGWLQILTKEITTIFVIMPSTYLNALKFVLKKIKLGRIAKFSKKK
jgi:hypothetical protein